jgi:hypothetical protein
MSEETRYMQLEREKVENIIEEKRQEGYLRSSNII